jgi:cytochrome o ubiquinol oxidase subunit 2
MTNRRSRTVLAVALLCVLQGCGALDHGFLNAQGPVAAHERHFFLITCGILAFVALPVLILVPLIAWHYRLSNTHHAYRPEWSFSWTLEGFIWIPPIGIVVLLAFLLWPATRQDDPYTRLAERGAPIRVQAIGLDWKWVFIYPEQGIATVNELAVPTGRAVQVELTSGTVMQSMLLPQLAGQIYAMAGMRTRLNFAADRDGRYLGENTQFNGDGFAHQKFEVVAMPDEAYRAWIAQARAAGRPLDPAAWRALSARGTAPPGRYSAVPPGFFDRVMAEATGGHAHPHPQQARANDAGAPSSGAPR